MVSTSAIGQLIGVRLARAGADVSAIARGATAAALRAHGWRLRSDEGMVSARVRVAVGATELGPADLVVIAVKGPSLASVAAGLRPCFMQAQRS